MSQSKETAIRAWKWMINPENTRESDAGKQFSVRNLHVQVFRGQTKEDVNETLNFLQRAGVVGECFLGRSTGGRPPELRVVASNWLTETCESCLRDLLSTWLEAGPEIHETQDLDSAHQTVTAIHEWLCDERNSEVGHLNELVFSLTRLCKEVPDAGEFYQFLLKQKVITRYYIEPNVRRRHLCVLNPDWLREDKKEMLLKRLEPDKPDEFISVGPLRVLHTCSVPIEGSMLKLTAGQIITNKHDCHVLMKTNAPVAPITDREACMCPKSTCRTRFKLSDQPSIDRPVLIALRYFYFPFNGGHMLCFREGDLISREDLVTFLLSGGDWPVKIASPAEFRVCPKCGEFALFTTLVGDFFEVCPRT